MCSRSPRHTGWDAPENKPEESFTGQDIAKGRRPVQQARNTLNERRPSMPTGWDAPERHENTLAGQEATTDQWSVPQAGNARNEGRLPMPSSWSAPEKPEKPLGGEETATGQRYVPQDRKKRHDLARSRPEAGAASRGETSFQQHGVHESSTRSNKTGTSQPCSYKDRFVVKKHKPEAPEEQRRMLKNLHRDVLQSIDWIVLAIRRREPCTVADWDHFRSHDEEIETIRDEICDMMNQVFEATTTSQQDHIVELEGLVEESRRQVSNLEKMLADHGLFRQSRAAAMAQEDVKPTGDVSTQTPSLPDVGNGHGVNNERDHGDQAESASVNQSIMSKLDDVLVSQKRTEDGMKYLDEVKNELKTTRDELTALLSARSGGDDGGSTGGTGRVDGHTGKQGGNQDAQKNAGDSTNKASGEIAQEPETPPVTPWGTEHSDGAWGSDDRENPCAVSNNPSSSVSTRRTSTRRHSASNTDDWKAPAVASTRRITPGSKMLKKCLKVDGEKGRTRATAGPEGAKVSWSMDPSPVAGFGKSQW